MALTVLATPDQIAAYRLIALRAALKLEIKFPGMRATRTALVPIIARELGYDGRTKIGALAHLEKYLTAAGIV